MLYETLSMPETGIHIEQWLCTLTGNLDREAFRYAWQWELNRHAMFRTCFVWDNRTEPEQITLQSAPLLLEEYDLRTLSPVEQEASLDRYVEENRVRGFNLIHPPLMRLALFQLTDETYRFVLTYHHILMDLWCLHFVIKEVFSCYQEYNRGQPFQLEASLPYTEYLAWLKRQSLGDAEHFWRKSLAGFAQPTAPGRPGEPDSQANAREARMSDMLPLAASTMAKLQQIARQQHLTLNTLFQGTWALILSRYSEKDDVLFGITVSGRPPELVGIESMVGLCINTLPLRMHVTGQTQLWDWLSELQNYNLELRQYEYTPAGFIHAWSDVPTGEALYESLLVVENFPESFATLARTDNALAVSASELKGAQTRHTLTILATPGEHSNIGCIYDGQRISPSMVRQVLEHFCLLLATIASGDDLSLESLRRLIPEGQIPVLYPIRQKQAIINPPRTPIEQRLAAIWQKVLGLTAVNIYANFLESGGHSLLATQLVSRIRTAFQIELPLRRLFETPTIAGLAEIIAKITEQSKATMLAPIPAIPRDQPLPLSFAQQRLWFLDQLFPQNSWYNISRALRIQGQLNIPVLKRSIAEIIARHEVLRTTFVQIDTETTVQKINPQANLAWSEADLQHIPAEMREAQAFALLQIEAQKWIDLSTGPLLRLLLVRLNPDDYILAVTVHHIVFDVWSEGIFVRELLALYKAFSAGQPSPLARLSLQYADFAVWQRQWLQGNVLDEQVAYWRQQLYNASPLTLPTDHARKRSLSHQGAMSPFSLDKELSTSLNQLSQQEGVTLFMTLLAGFMSLLHRYSGQTDIIVGTDIANRTRTETEQLIGFFVNVLMLRGNLGGNPQFRQLLQQISQTVLDAYTHQDLLFEKLIEVLHLAREGDQIPLARVLFVFQNTPWVELDLEDLKLTPIEVEQNVTRFELAFFMW
ncbi:MAG TPA: condensation domain-containing protein, partial [Ktedonobacteraceae bacterium]|nr:condensation domain-containing protein [Ktedonobacteraceae bacterium]